MKHRPVQKPGRSKQDYGTPPDFIAAVERRFGKLDWDLAATAKNAKAPKFITPKQDSLLTPWPTAGNLWLNPPFANIEPWAARCAGWSLVGAESGARLLLLTPLSSANWVRDHVFPNASIIALNGRLTFEGETTPYPKDCMLSLFGWPNVQVPFEVWDWRRKRRC